MTGTDLTPPEAARTLFEASSPRTRRLHLFEAEDSVHTLVVEGSRIYRLKPEAAHQLGGAVASGDEGVIDDTLTALGIRAASWIGDDPPAVPAVKALSLAVAQKCNLGCVYCYAQGGDFGATPRSMSEEVARASVELLLSGAKPGDHLNLAFLGGEPLANRLILRAAADYAAARAHELGVWLGFSITTNGTLLTVDDGAFFERHGFAVTVSLDSVGAVHDRLRPTKGGTASFDRIIANITPLLAMQRRMQISARVTVTPSNLRLRETLDHFIGLGFHSVGFSPMLASPTGLGTMGHDDLAVMLEQMIDCGREFERQVVAGLRYPLANMVNAMKELHRGTHRPYPCGAGAGYLGVSSDGDLAACHRFVGEEAGTMGSLATGIDLKARERWLADRHVHRQEPCKACWARYLCGGGCHHEVIHRGRPACDYIRGWLHYCLQAYVRLSAARPEYFGAPARN
jgi:uncharacterized protein